MTNSKKRAKKTKDEITKYQDAIAFAEEGEYDDAVKFIEETSSGGEIQPRLLVVGNGNMFSPCVVDYSIDMAKRLEYQIVALNAAPIGDELPVKSLERKRLRDEFLTECEKKYTAV